MLNRRCWGGDEERGLASHEIRCRDQDGWNSSWRAGGCHHDGVILAIWPSLINPAVRLMMFGIGFTLAGLGVLAMLWKNRQTWWQRRAAHRTSMAKIGSVRDQ